MKKTSMITIIFIALIVLAAIGFAVYRLNFFNGGDDYACTAEAKICPDGSTVVRTGPKCEFSACPEGGEVEKKLSEAEARVVAERTCIKGGESLAPGYYNENTKTWWFDANLNAVREGCNPACVVSEESGQAEINWRCTGLVIPEGVAKAIKELFIGKYPKYASTTMITIAKETADHARGSVIFVPGQPGGLFLATKIDGKWQIVHEGNGEIPCNLSRYNFPADMLADCAK